MVERTCRICQGERRLEFIVGGPSVCWCCNGTGTQNGRATPEEERQYEAKKLPTVGTREWAIQQMALGHNMIDRYGRRWRPAGRRWEVLMEGKWHEHSPRIGDDLAVEWRYP